VFISYSSHDQKIADAACAALEQSKLRCWIAPRDILPGADWGGAIVQGIEECRLFVLVYTSHSNQSQQVLREVERAVANGLPIIPLRLDTTAPTKSMEYFISSQHWMDALNPPLEAHLKKLTDTAKRLLSGKSDTLPVAIESTKPAESHVSGRRAWQWLLAAAAVIVAGFGANHWLNGRTRDPSKRAEPSVSDHGSKASDAATPQSLPNSQAQNGDDAHDPIFLSVMNERFERFDGDRNDSLSAPELRRIPGIHAQEGDALIRLFNLIDVDSNQTISREELLNMTRVVLKTMDGDGDERLDRTEFLAQPRFRGRDKQRAGMTAFREADSDRDNYLSVKEMERAQAEAMLSKK
jgi:Ca2+-binding EF-hand superfamily protein